MRPLAIIGPTGTGKSQLALDVVEQLSGEVGAEIVNADAMQLYRGMDIGTAKLPVEQRRGIPHWAVIPCLLVTLLAGPIGLLVYLAVRAAFGRGGVLLAEQPEA